MITRSLTQDQVMEIYYFNEDGDIERMTYPPLTYINSTYSTDNQMLEIINKDNHEWIRMDLIHRIVIRRIEEE